MKYLIIIFLILGTNLNAAEFLVYSPGKTLAEQLVYFDDECFDMPQWDYIVWEDRISYSRKIDRFKPLKVSERLVKIIHTEYMEQNFQDIENSIAAVGVETEYAIVDFETEEILLSKKNFQELEKFIKNIR
ncbi:MAG: hypothetical protein AB8G05_17050 [Oligoflexales bacterium]